MSDLGERVREGEEREEQGNRERDSIIIMLQEKVCTIIYIYTCTCTLIPRLPHTKLRV